MKRCMAVVLAAGESKRMNSKIPKVLHNICGIPVIEWVYNSIKCSGINDITLVVGHCSNQVMSHLGDKVKYVEQRERLGTAHAVMQAERHFKEFEGNVLIICGDTPLITSNTITESLSFHKQNENSATVLSTTLVDASGYGRIIRDAFGNISNIVEDKDASNDEKSITEVNSGIYWISSNDLCECLHTISNLNSQNEFYLTDIISSLVSRNKKAGVFNIKCKDEILGINNRVQLAEASNILNKRVLNKLMLSGVTIIDPESTFIDDNVHIGMDTVIYPGTIVKGPSSIGEDCQIGPNTEISNSTLSHNISVRHSVVLESQIDDHSTIGPFAYLRPGNRIGKNVKIGDFVEIKNSSISDSSKVSHLTYIGDAEIGKNVNFGCGTVVVNYDGIKKHKTVVLDNSFVGCNTNLVAPVEIGEGSYIAAGSTITKPVPPNSLAIARSQQIIKDNWALKRRMRAERNKKV